MSETPVKSRARFQFELRHLLWATVLLAASLGLFGGWGILATLLVVWVWSSAFSDMRKAELKAAKAAAEALNDGADDLEPESPSDAPDRSGYTLVELLVVIAIIGILLALLWPAYNYRGWSRHRLYQVSQALDTYHTNHGCLPPAYLTDDSGKPAHSWRVLILPELGHQNLYNQYRFDEPWDSVHNRKLLAETPREYRYFQRPSSLGDGLSLEPGSTACLAVTGDGAAWRAGEPATIESPTDSSKRTVLIVEAEFQSVPWTKPEDFGMDDVSLLVDPPDNVDQGRWRRGFFRSTYRGRYAIWVGAESYFSVDFLPPCNTAQMKELLTANDGKPDSQAEYLYADPPAAWRRVHYLNIARLAVFLVAAAWPIVWVVERRRDRRRSKMSNQGSAAP